MIGTSMGSRPAPSYANLFMAKRIDPKIIELATELNNGNNPIKFLKRFLDDIFMVYRGTLESLHNFMEELNKIHPTIKFTMSHTIPYQNETHNQTTCNCEASASLAFLDTSCQINNGQIIVDLYRKQIETSTY